MQHSRLFIACTCLLFANHSQAQETPPSAGWQLCQAPDYLPYFHNFAEQPQGEKTDDSANISSDQFNILKKEESVFSGNVELSRGKEWLSTDTLRFNHDSEQYQTEGLVRFQNENIRATAESAQGDNKNNRIELNKLNYQFNTSNGNGSADKVVISGTSSQLQQASFSTCPSNQKQWQFVADEIVVNDKTHRGSAKNVRLKVGNVPIFWLPFMQFPTDDKRATGVLSPKIGHDQLNGYDIALPVYLNLAPNYDATLTPRFFSNRGAMLETEFRYVSEQNAGNVIANYLPDDDIRHRNRSRFEWQHFTAINHAWNFQSVLSHVSDEHYFSDFGSTINETSTALIKSEVGFHGRGKYWNLDVTASDWQIANPTQAPGSEPFRRVPRISMSGSKPFKPWLEVGLNAEVVVFVHDQLTDGNRLDIEPFIKFPIIGSNWYATPSLSWRQTQYWMAFDSSNPLAERNFSRGLSIFSLDAGANFERNTQFGERSYIQTLEPRIYYLKVPYRDQNQLPVFDTQALTFMWPSLFRENRYGGADRQADADQLTLAFTSRLLDSETGKERFNFSLGRISYFEAPKVHLPGEALLPKDGSAWIAEANVRLSDQWQLGLTQHWNPTNKNTEFSSIRSYWSLPSGLQINASYRYRANYAEQTDLAFVIPLNQNWRALGRWNYSLRDKQNLESLLGLEWRSCCMAFRIFGRKYIRSFDSRENMGIYIELELNGLGQIGTQPELFKDNGILAY